MGVDIQAVICPQCGAADIEFTSDTTAVCKICGTQIVISPEHQTAEDIIEDLKDEDGIDHFIIYPKYLEKDFVKSVWIGLSKDETPEDIFSAKVSDPEELTHTIVQDHVSVDVSYQVSIGYDRQEPYTAYETYTEQEPYIAYEKQYNSTAQRYEERQVTKYKPVQKKRQVTKYKTVTDWSPLSGEYSLESTVWKEDSDAPFNEKQFLDEFCAIPDSDTDAVLPPKNKELAELTKRYRVSDKLDEAIMNSHASNLNAKLASSLPGDHYKDLVSNIDCITERSTVVYWTQEYVSQVSYKGQNYKKHAYPFGNMRIYGDGISGGLDEWQAASWGPVKKLSYVLMGVLAASILLSCFVHVTWLVIAAFAAAVGLFIYHRTTVSKVEADILSKRRKQKTEALNRKLRSLGFSEATDEELKKWRGYV